METYVYKALKSGKLISGEVDGEDEDEVKAKLKEEDIDILSLKPKSSKIELEEKTEKISGAFSGGGKIKRGEKVFFYKNMATMLKAGLPILETINLLFENTKSKTLRSILQVAKYEVEKGTEISKVFSKYPKAFSHGELSMIKIGEVSGTLPDCFHGLFKDAESEARLRKDIKGALMYPIIISSIMGVIALALFIFVIPQLTSFFVQSNMKIPRLTQITMSMSSFLKNNFLFIFVGVIIFTVVFQVLAKRSLIVKKIKDKVLIRIPWVGRQFKGFYIYKITKMLSLLIKSGIPILEALDIVSKSISHVLYVKSIEETALEVKKGVRLSEALKKYPLLYPPFVVRMLVVGDRTGKTDEALLNISETYEEDLRDTLANLSSMIEPLLMVVLGLGVAFVAISVLIPMYSVVSGINEL